MPFTPTNPAHAGPYRSDRGANVGCLAAVCCGVPVLGGLAVGAVALVRALGA